MNITFTKVKKVLCEVDIEGFMPADEYIEEAEKITRQLNLMDSESFNAENALLAIIPIWSDCFSLDGAAVEKRIPFLQQAVDRLFV